MEHAMAIGRFFKSLVDSETMGEEIIRVMHDMYAETTKFSPQDDAHMRLSSTYFSRIRARHKFSNGVKISDIDNESGGSFLLTETLLYSCLADGDNIRALAIKVLREERDDIYEKFKKFDADFDRRIGPLFLRLQRGEKLYDIYRSRNPKLQIKQLNYGVFIMLESGQLEDMLL
jgi:hypothetical protein